MANDLKPLQDLQAKGLTAGIIDYIAVSIGGFSLPGIVSTFSFPVLERETVETPGQLPANVPTRIFKPVMFEFELLTPIPELMGIISRSPTFRFVSTKSRLALLTEETRYQDAVEVLGAYLHETRGAQEFKGIDKTTVHLSLHTFLHKYGDGINTFEVAYYRTQPPEVRIQGEIIVGGLTEQTLITF